MVNQKHLAEAVKLINFGSHYYTVGRYMANRALYGARVTSAIVEGDTVVLDTEAGDRIVLAAIVHFRFFQQGTITFFADEDEEHRLLVLETPKTDPAYDDALAAANQALGRTEPLWPDNGLETAG